MHHACNVKIVKSEYSCTIVQNKYNRIWNAIVSNVNRPISRVVIGREVDYRSRFIYVRYCLTNTTLCL